MIGGWGGSRGVGEMYKTWKEVVGRQGGGRAVIKHNSTSRGWLEPALQLKAEQQQLLERFPGPF